MNLILCGLQMSGKTTVGKMVADKLHRNFIDTDQLIEDAYNAKTGKILSCRQIFIQEGKNAFRALEKQQLTSLKELTHSVIAVGGGCLEDSDNIESLRLAGYLIYLKSQINVLWQRLLLAGRGIPAYLDPQYPEKSFYEIAERRMPLYEVAAHVIIDTNYLSERETVEAILSYGKIRYGK